jgi:hypothetical protein
MYMKKTDLLMQVAFLAFATGIGGGLLSIGYILGRHERQVSLTSAVCTYEGLECPNAQRYAGEYQMDITEDSLFVRQGDRHVSTLPWPAVGLLDSIIMADNY